MLLSRGLSISFSFGEDQSSFPSLAAEDQSEHVKQKSSDPEQHDLLITNTTSALKGLIGYIEQDHNRAV